MLACGYNQFQCQTGHNCISQCKVCDGDFDCSDGSDEANCSMYHTICFYCLSTYGVINNFDNKQMKSKTIDKESDRVLIIYLYELVLMWMLKDNDLLFVNSPILCVYFLRCVEVVTLLHSSVVVPVNESHCVNVVMVNETAWTAVMNSTAVRYFSLYITSYTLLLDPGRVPNRCEGCCCCCCCYQFSKNAAKSLLISNQS